MQIEILDPRGVVSYRRPHDHPMIAEALDTPGYSLRVPHPVGMAWLELLPTNQRYIVTVDQDGMRVSKESI